MFSHRITPRHRLTLIFPGPLSSSIDFFGGNFRPTVSGGQCLWIVVDVFSRQHSINRLVTVHPEPDAGQLNVVQWRVFHRSHFDIIQRSQSPTFTLDISYPGPQYLRSYAKPPTNRSKSSCPGTWRRTHLACEHHRSSGSTRLRASS